MRRDWWAWGLFRWALRLVDRRRQAYANAMRDIEIEQATDSMADLVDEVEANGSVIVILRNGAPVALLVLANAEDQAVAARIDQAREELRRRMG